MSETKKGKDREEEKTISARSWAAFTQLVPNEYITTASSLQDLNIVLRFVLTHF